MEVIMSSEDRHTSLPKLSTSKELSRRDSLSSSRTRDSGYNSDPDVAFSPLDFADSDQHTLFASFPITRSAFIDSSRSFLKSNRANQELLPSQRPNITSNPAFIETVDQSTPRYTSRIDLTSSRARSRVSIHHQAEPDVASEDAKIEKWIKDNLPSYNRPKERVASITSLSSSSSCDMYTNTDASDDDQDTSNEAVPHSPTSAVRMAINLIMRKVDVNLRFAAYMQCNGGSPPSATSTHTSTCQPDDRKISRNSAKRKSRSNDHLPPDDSEEDGPSKRRRGSLATVASSDTSLRFACPFYKHDPIRYRNRRTCPGPGWQTVHRMKEHLYRAHAQSIYCPRCYSMFDADIELSNHLRMQHCQVSAPQPLEGIDRETLQALRKRSPALRLEEDKWRDVYSLLFPDVANADIPSPFYDGDSPNEQSRRFRRELLQRVQAELMTVAEHTPGPIEQQLLHQVAGIIRRCEDELLSSFEGLDATAPALTDRRGSTTSNASTISTRPDVTTTSDPSTSHDQTGADTSGQCQQFADHVRITPVQLPVPPWQTPSGYCIDWDSLFPLSCDGQLQGHDSNEPYVGFAESM